ncbi:MAG TPA: L-threonylcarbamoyladenylate synthase [Patescibacteria group bacterium]|nr:L-threonylcarbamoyladenylate synthase [Patescibacteria group bacterium]
MIVIDYNSKKHKEIIHAAVLALTHGKAVVFPTDTSYGLAVDATNAKAVKKLYAIKGRGFNKPVHVIVPSQKYCKQLVLWDAKAQKLAKAFWPGALTLVLSLKSKNTSIKAVSAKTGYIGLRYPDNTIALDLAKKLGRPITATSANISGGMDSYSIADIYKNFKYSKQKPDIVLNAGKLRKKMPSTLLKITDTGYEILRKGPVTEKQITKILHARKTLL